MDNLQKRIDEILSVLPPSLDSLNPSPKGNLVPYLQHVPGIIDRTQFEFLCICQEIIGGDVFTKGYPEVNVNRFGIVGRYIDDSGNSTLNRNWYRFMCIDDYYREFTQPYFAINCEKFGTNLICVNNTLPQLIEYFRDKKIDQIIQ